MGKLTTAGPGRPPGARNKRTVEFMRVLEDSGFCPATALVDVYKISMARFTEEVEREDKGLVSPMESNAAKYLKIAADQASDLASYAYPKLKSIERVKDANPLDGMADAQKLEMMRAALTLFESQVKARGES